LLVVDTSVWIDFLAPHATRANTCYAEGMDLGDAMILASSAGSDKVASFAAGAGKRRAVPRSAIPTRSMPTTPGG